jgi:hypothetical protein
MRCNFKMASSEDGFARTDALPSLSNAGLNAGSRPMGSPARDRPRHGPATARAAATTCPGTGPQMPISCPSLPTRGRNGHRLRAGLSGRDRRSRTRPGLKPQLKISRTRSGMPLASLQGCLLHRGSDCVGTSSSKRRGNHRFQSWNERVGMRALELRIYPTTANEEDAS